MKKPYTSTMAKYASKGRIMEAALAERWGLSPDKLRRRRAAGRVPDWEQRDKSHAVLYSFRSVQAWEADHGITPQGPTVGLEPKRVESLPTYRREPVPAPVAGPKLVAGDVESAIELLVEEVRKQARTELLSDIRKVLEGVS